MSVLTDPSAIRDRLAEARTIAILGAHTDPWRAGFYVPEYLQAQGYRVLPVNPALAGRTLWGEPVVATLADLPVPVDLVDVFRRRDHLVEHFPELLAMDPRPRTVWFQLGIRDDVVAEALADAGFDVVQDRCTLADHRHFALGPVR